MPAQLAESILLNRAVFPDPPFRRFRLIQGPEPASQDLAAAAVENAVFARKLDKQSPRRRCEPPRRHDPIPFRHWFKALPIFARPELVRTSEGLAWFHDQKL